MATATGYMVSKSYGWCTQQTYRIADKVLDSSKLKFGGFNYNPVITRIPSGYARTGAYIRQDSSDGGINTNVFSVGLCNFDTLEDRNETSTFGMTGSVFVAVYDTGEFIVALPNSIALALELLNPISLSPIGFMVWQSEDNSAVFITQSEVTYGSVAVIMPEPIRVGDTVKVSRVYFVTPLGLAVTRRLYSANTANTNISMSLQIGSNKFIRVGLYLIDITGEV
jgi:hypothetical protein